LGDSHIKIKKGYCAEKTIGPDKYNNILEGNPVKKGIIDINKKTREKRPV
jgi:hypothetical protein